VHHSEIQMLFFNGLAVNLHPVKLSELTIGKSARIVSFSNEKLKLRLFDLGCIPGEIIVLEHQTPMNDPMIIRVNQTRLALRLSNASEIEVELC
jgi:ferrous iron transport protein A